MMKWSLKTSRICDFQHKLRYFWGGLVSWCPHPLSKICWGQVAEGSSDVSRRPNLQKKSRWTDRQRGAYVACEYSVSQFANRYTFGELDVIW